MPITGFGRTAILALVGAGVVAASSAAVGADTPLLEAVKNRDTAAVQALVSQRVDVNIPQADGATALHWAAHWDDVAVADLLINAGARVNAANDYGVVPLLLAATNGSTAMVARLLSAGADPNAGDGERGDPTDVRRPNGPNRGGRGVAGSWCRRRREGRSARTDGTDVGRVGRAPGGPARAHSGRRRRAGPVGSWVHAVAVCGA